MGLWILVDLIYSRLISFEGLGVALQVTFLFLELCRLRSQWSIGLALVTVYRGLCPRSGTRFPLKW